jgi:hypothetical protein
MIMRHIQLYRRLNFSNVESRRAGGCALAERAGAAGAAVVAQGWGRQRPARSAARPGAARVPTRPPRRPRPRLCILFGKNIDYIVSIYISSVVYYTPVLS